MRKLILSFLLLFTIVASIAQNKEFTITGTVITDDDKQPLESATVYLEHVRDSSVVSYTISDKNGKFTIEDKTTDNALNIFISFVGLELYKKTIVVKNGDINLSTISLKENKNMLDEVVIRSRAPITIKKDTLEFSVKAFQTKKDANVEDLLKKLPGVEVDDEGVIKVNKILVNGKPFFGNDPTITTRNLSKELIEKIQVSDTKTKSEAFTGEEGDKESKTINLVIEGGMI